MQMNCTRGKKLIQLEDARQVKASFVSVCVQPSPAQRSPYMMSARLSLNLLLCFVLALKAAEL